MILTQENFDRLVYKTSLMICNKVGNSVVKLFTYIHNILYIEKHKQGMDEPFHGFDISCWHFMKDNLSFLDKLCRTNRIISIQRS